MRNLCLALAVTSLVACDPIENDTYYDDDWSDDDVTSPGYGGSYGGSSSGGAWSGGGDTFLFHNDSDTGITVAVYEPPSGLCLGDPLFASSQAPTRLPYVAALAGTPVTFTLDAWSSASLPTYRSLCHGRSDTYAIFAVNVGGGAYLATSPDTITLSQDDQLSSSGGLVELERESTCAAPAAAPAGRLVLPPGRASADRVTAHRVEGNCTILSFAAADDAAICGAGEWPFAGDEAVDARLRLDGAVLESTERTVHYTRIKDPDDFGLLAAELVVRGGATCGNVVEAVDAACQTIVRDVTLATTTGRSVALGTNFDVAGRTYLVTDASETLLGSPCGGSDPTAVDIGLIVIERHVSDAGAPTETDAGAP